MDRVDAMKSLQGWTDTSVLHFHNLGVFGEQILLAIRYGAWTDPSATTAQARNWARFWRAEIQGYIHAYRAATGVDLTTEATDTQLATERYLQPSVHLLRQLEHQRRGLPAASRMGARLNGALTPASTSGARADGAMPAIAAGRGAPARR